VAPEGYVIASYATVFENTKDVINDRRSELLHSIMLEISKAEDFSSLWAHFLRGLQNHGRDLPLAMIYSNYNSSHDSSPKNSSLYTLEGALGVQPGHIIAPQRIRLDSTDFLASAIRTARSTLAPVILRCSDGTLPESVLESIEWRGYGVPVTELAVWPVQSGSEVPAVALFGLNPHRRADADYQLWLNQMIQLVMPKMTSILLSQERERRAMMAEENAVERERLSNLLQEEMKFSRFADRAPVGLCVTDTLGEILFANDSWYYFSGLNPTNHAPMSWMNTVIPEDLEVLEEAWRKITLERKSLTFQVRTKEPFEEYSERNGPMHSLYKTGLCAAYPDIDASGAVTSVMGIIVDISELKWTEEQVRLRTSDLNDKMEEAILLKSRQENFIDMISHEIRNPLSAVLHCAEEILECVRHYSHQLQDTAYGQLHKVTQNSSPVLKDAIDAAQTILYCVEHQKRKYILNF
jgi:PAS domain S-box-containing protein